MDLRIPNHLYLNAETLAMLSVLWIMMVYDITPFLNPTWYHEMPRVKGIKTSLAQCMTLRKQCLNLPLLSIPFCTLEMLCLVRTVINSGKVCLVIGILVWSSHSLTFFMPASLQEVHLVFYNLVHISFVAVPFPVPVSLVLDLAEPSRSSASHFNHHTGRRLHAH